MKTIYPRRGTPPDKFGYPHYQAIQKANLQLEKDYQTLLSERVNKRIKSITLLDNKKLASTRATTKKSLGKLFKCKTRKSSPTPLPTQTFQASSVIESEAIKITTYSITTQLKTVSFSIIKPHSSQPKNIMYLCLPDIALKEYGLNSIEETIKANSFLLKAGCTLIIPELQSIKHLSSTLNKGLILKGSCVFREALEELSLITNSLHSLSESNNKCIGLTGAGFGANLALFLNTLYDHFIHCLLDKPITLGQTYTQEELLIPAFNTETDMLSLLVANCHKPVILLPNKSTSPLDTKSLVSLSKANKKLTITKSISTKVINNWLSKQNLSHSTSVNENLVFDALVHRRHNINAVKTAQQLTKLQKNLERIFKEKMNIKAINAPLKIEKIHQVQTKNYLKTEYHVTTEKNCKINLVTIFQKKQSEPLPTIICLPGSGSDVAQCENTYAEEVIAKGWNAVIIDARVALYEFHPSIAENIAIISQGVKDILACNQWIYKQPEVDPSKVVLIGGSQGGTHSWMVAALDKKIAAAAPMVGFCTYKSLLTDFVTSYYGGGNSSFLDSHSSYYFIPGILEVAEQQDLCSLIAPRPLMILAANKDNCFPISGIKEGVKELSALHKRLGFKNKLKTYVFDGPHSYKKETREKAYQFFKNVFKDL